MTMRATALTVFLCLLSLYPLSAQYEGGIPETVDVQQNLVVATTGLSIREAPRLSAKRLGVVPFGKKVTIRSTKSYGTTVLREHDAVKWLNAIEGQWVKVQYGTLTGYVLNAYLIDPTYIPDPIASLNQSVVLLRPGSNCISNLWYQTDWHWYGIYKTATGYETRSVKPTFTHNWSLNATLNIHTKNDQGLRYIIGSRRPLPMPQHPVNQVAADEGSLWPADPDQQNGPVQVCDVSAAPCAAPCTTPVLSLTDPAGQSIQRLNPSTFPFNRPNRLEWCGDLDGDGKTDYIVFYGEEESHLVLYLSSYAEEGQAVKAVAVYFGGYCC